MGCDIHVCCEYRDNADSEWKCADVFYLDGYEPRKQTIYDDRCYDLFGMLAGIRSNQYDEIDEPRDIPDDCCDWTLKSYRSWGCDAHSASYFTYRELIDRLSVCSHEDDGYSSEYDTLESLVSPVFYRMKDVFPIYYISDTDKKYWDNKILKHADDFRIVFWFDN